MFVCMYVCVCVGLRVSVGVSACMRVYVIRIYSCIFMIFIYSYRVAKTQRMP